MYLKNVDIKNYGAIEDLTIETQFYENGNPKPLLITGHNGAGKTLLLTNIVDAMIEMKKTERGYDSQDEILAYKAENKKYIHTGASEYIVKMRFEENDKMVDYIDVVSKKISASMKKEVIKELQSKERFLETGCYKNTSQGSYQIQKQVLAYFPTDRYYNPAWFDKKDVNGIYSAKRQMTDKKGASKIIKGNLLEKVETWMLDVLLDKYLYEQVVETKDYFVQDHIENGEEQYVAKQVKEFVGYKGKNSTLLSVINSLLSVIYSNKYDNLEYARIGVSSKRDRSISIFIKKKKDKEFEIASDFTCLSSGEIMVLSLFVSILKEYDEINASRHMNLEQVEGIVVIDEVDQNLHIRFAKEILPILISTFPKVQFIMTTHSPFFLVGMQDAMKEEFYCINMPNGETLNHVKGYDEIKACYEKII